MALDITKTGPQSYRQLQQQNQKEFNPETATTEDWYKQLRKRDYNSYSAQPTEYVGLEAAEAGYGNSQYDEGLVSTSQLQDLGDIRYENQPWYDTLANGVGKMLGTAGTTFVSSLVGLPYGLFQAANQGRWSALWDNDVTQGLAEADKWLEENMTNYRSQVQQNSPWYSPDNLFSMNFIADDVIKNMGFTLGAAASMAVGSGSLGLMSKALGFVNDVGKTTKMGQAALSALFSATGEGMIEARQGVEERNKLETQRLEDALTPEYNALEMQKQEIEQQYALTGDYDNYRQQMLDLQNQKQTLDNKKAAGLQQIQESGLEMGNKILLANQGLLTLGNLIQFGKGMVKSFDSARHAAEVSSKAVKPTLVGAERLADGTYKVVGKNAGRALAATKGILTEGSEEMNQQWIQSSAGASANEVDVNDYWRAKLDPEAYRETTQGLYTVGSILDRGFQESWGDVNQWEQFVIGGLTGMAGSYTPTKLFNQDKTKAAWDPRRYGSWEGGAINELRDFNREYNQYQENIDDLNKILQSEDFPARIKSAVGHTYTQGEKDAAVEGDDKKAWKDADDKQNIHDVQAFLRAGKLDDLRAIYNELGSQLSDDDVQNIIKSTTKEISAEEDKQNFNRQADEQIAAHQRRITELQQQAQDIGDSQDMLEGAERADYQVAVMPELEKIFANIDSEYDAISQLEQQKEQYVPQRYFEGAYVDRDGNQIVSNDEIKQTVGHNSEELNRKLNSYLDSIDYVNRRTNGVLTKDQEDNLAYLHNLGKESNVRMQKIMADVRKQLPKTFLLKTSKTPEQLTQENASSDLVFTKDENTKEGYVEVDTSMMNDTAFADFFQREVMRGGNIRPEFAETADEKAAREEEEKNLPEAERKKKARERASKKWQNAIQKMQDDANEQWDTNWRNLVDNFMDNYKKDNNATLDETVEAFSQVRQNLQDASDLFDQAGEFQRTLMEYMANPSKVDEDKAKAETEAQKAADEKQAKNQFAGKDASEIKQGLADGSIDFDDFSDFAGADLSDVTDEDVKAAQQEVKKAQEGNQKASALKQHIQEQLGDNPTQEELNAAQMAMQMVDQANLATENPEDLNIAMPELTQVPLDQVDPDASIEDVDALNMSVQQMLADAFNAFEEDKNAQDDIPDTAPTGALDGVEAPETGHDATTKTKPEVVAPKGKPLGTTANGPIDPTKSSSPSEAASEPLPKNPLTEGALGTIISETSKLYDKPNTNGTWRSTTTRHPYGKSTGTYHETLPDKNSIQYKRSKAIWEGLNETGAFDRQDNSSTDRIKPGDTVHFFVSYLPEVYDKDFDELTAEEKPYAMVIMMLNNNGEIIGDLPLAQLEPSYRSGNPTQQVKDLLSLQDKVFKAFIENRKKTGAEAAVVDGDLTIEGADNLNLTFDGSKKPLLSKVKQVMKGVVPYRYGEINTLNEVANGQPFELGVAVTGTTIAKKRGDKTQHKKIVMPHVGTTGQPYLLLPTPSGEQIAVPFYMKPFDANQHRNTEFYKLLTNAIYSILTNNTSKNVFKKNMDVIEGLLQVKVADGVKNAIDVRKDSVTMHLQSLTDANNKMDITVPFNQNTSELAMAMVDQLSGIPINVSLQFLNDTIEAGGRKANYNNVVGEIADVNLPKATNHTVNGWFTVELAPSADIKPSKKVTPRTTGVISETVGGKNIEINTDTLVAYDPTTGEVITDNEEVNLRLAQIKAAKPQYQGKDRIQVSINGELRTYDTKENKFVKNAPIQKAKSDNRDFLKEIESANSVSEIISITNAAVDAQRKGIISADELISISGAANQKKTTFKTDDVTPPTSGNVGFGEQLTPLDILISWTKGELSKEDAIKQLKGSQYVRTIEGSKALNTSDKTTFTKEVEVALGKHIQERWPFLKVERVTVATGISTFGGDAGLLVVKDANGVEYGSPSNFLHSIANKGKALQAISQQPQIQTKTLEQIESEMKQKKIVGRQTKDAWAAIPDDLKLKLVNEGVTLQLAYFTQRGETVFKNSVVNISMSDREGLIKALTQANMAAKAGNMKVSEAAKPMEKSGRTISKENEQAARRWLAKNLPTLSSEERTQFVEKLSRMGDDAGKYWGSYRSGVIQIQRNAPMGTVYHEAFHYVMDMVLSPEERQQILDIAKEEYGINDNWMAEERLANDFRRYAMDENAEGFTGRLRRLFRKLMDKITRYNRISDATINQLFWKINNGELAQKAIQTESFEDNQQRVLMEIRNVQKEKLSWRNLPSDTRKALSSSGLSEAVYEQMSLEEKDQYVKCRG